MAQLRSHRRSRRGLATAGPAYLQGLGEFGQSTQAGAHHLAGNKPFKIVNAYNRIDYGVGYYYSVQFAGVPGAAGNLYIPTDRALLDQWLNVSEWAVEIVWLPNLDGFYGDGFHSFDTAPTGIDAAFTLAAGRLATFTEGTPGTPTFDSTTPVDRGELYLGRASTGVYYEASGTGSAPVYPVDFMWTTEFSLGIPHGAWGYHNARGKWLIGLNFTASLTTVEDPASPYELVQIVGDVTAPPAYAFPPQAGCPVNHLWDTVEHPPDGYDTRYDEELEQDVYDYACFPTIWTQPETYVLQCDPDAQGADPAAGVEFREVGTFLGYPIYARSNYDQGVNVAGSGSRGNNGELSITIEPESYYSTWF